MNPYTPYLYTGDRLREVAFPLGGVGTGCISLEGRGSLRDWEIFGRPNKGKLLEMTFPVLWCRERGGETQTRVVQGPRQKDFVGDSYSFWSYGHGQIRQQGDGLPHFSEAEFTGTFPFARIVLTHPKSPIRVTVTGFSPFIPLATRDSSFPIACLIYRLENVSDRPVDATLAFNMTNPVGLMQSDNQKLSKNEYREDDDCRGIYFTNGAFTENDPAFGSAALTTNWRDITFTRRWIDGEWFDALHHFWDTFSKSGELESKKFEEVGPRQTASLGLRAALTPGESVDLPICISWCFPNNVKYWGTEAEQKGHVWKQWYAQQWPDAWAAASEFFNRFEELYGRSLMFESALHDSTIPAEILESASATLAVLRSPTVLRLEDGTMWAWEGCSATEGCCSGSCTHVWNYALSHAYLFPDLHRTMRRSEYEHSFAPGEPGKKGAIAFRIPLPLTSSPTLFHAASDGQLGGIVQLYRDWKYSADDEYLREMWPHAKRALEYAWVEWDRDRDGLVDGDQHNTYDINFQGPNPLTQGFYLAALRAAAEMAAHLGEGDLAAEYRALCENGRAKAEQVLWNGEYFEQIYDVDATGAAKYQHGKGCLSDQLFGQLSAHVAGLGHLYDSAKVRQALEAVYRHNFKDPLEDHANMQRVYALADEPALILCSWPRGGRPAFPFPYSDESWTGIDYQVASHMIYEGLLDEALDIVRAARLRYDGRRRNPYNEFECGSHYARSLSAWGLLLAWTGFRSDGTPSFRPAVAGKMQAFYSTGAEWGTVEVDGDEVRVNVIERVAAIGSLSSGT